MIWIGFTTRYRTGGARLAQAAQTLEAEQRQAHPGVDVRCVAVETKAAFLDEMAQAVASGATISALHFLSHSGVYGPMFGTTDWPEQMSPHEWRGLDIPFATDGEAYFHACRTARWFAPFFARTFGVPASGFHWYTTFTTEPDRFRWPGPWRGDGAPLYLVGCPGKKSHGWVGSVAKYAGLASVEPMKRYLPEALDGDPSYNKVAALYDAAFNDIRVRGPEWRWLDARVADGDRVLDIGAGNGALLEALGPRIGPSAGVDRSTAMVALAQQRADRAGLTNLEFKAIDGPTLPFADNFFDRVTSLLSFRYLDWDPLMQELRRVLVPGGRFLVVDMVATPVSIRDLPLLIRGKVRERWGRLRNPEWHRARARLVADPKWQDMLRYNPIRAVHEMRWYLGSRFPEGEMAVLDIGIHASVLAFDSGPFDTATLTPMAYP